MNQSVTRSEIRVRYRETDQMAVAWHGNYIEWFEVARTDWLRNLGLSYRELEARGVLLPVLRVLCDYVRPARYDDILVIETKLQSYNGVRLAFSYIARTFQEESVVAGGQTEHTFADAGLRPIRVARREPEIHRLLEG
ncbi:MAG: acyl-CoA thioesterase [Bacilli bacterium]